VTRNAAHLAGYKDWTTAVKVWYDEESMYDYSAGQFSHETGHFTAMVSNSFTMTQHLEHSHLLCCMFSLVLASARNHQAVAASIHPAVRDTVTNDWSVH